MQTTGAVIIMNYASLIFGISGSALSIDASGIILAVIQILGGLVSTQLGDTFGRKTTLFISLSGSAFGLLTFTVYSYLRQNGYDVSSYLWLPVVCLSLIIFISSAGIVALANTCTVENFSPKVNKFCWSISSHNYLDYLKLKILTFFSDSTHWYDLLFTNAQWSCFVGWKILSRFGWNNSFAWFSIVSRPKLLPWNCFCSFYERD